MPLLLEYWKPVVGLEDKYEVSCTGKIRKTVSGEYIRQGLNAQGYPRVWFWYEGKTVFAAVHLVVAAAFLGPAPHGHEVDHVDTDKQNSRLSNLEYVTHAENMARAHRNGLMAKGQTLPQAKLTDDKVRRIKKMLPHMTAREIAAAHDVSEWTIHNIRQGRNWKHVV